MNQCLQNNAKMRQLGLLALSRILSTSPIILQETENNDHNDDPNFDDKAEDDANNDGNLSDDSHNLRLKRCRTWSLDMVARNIRYLIFHCVML